MIGLLGPPPQELLNRADSAIYSSLYNTQGMYDSASAHDARDSLATLLKSNLLPR